MISFVKLQNNVVVFWFGKCPQSLHSIISESVKQQFWANDPFKRKVFSSWPTIPPTSK